MKMGYQSWIVRGLALLLASSAAFAQDRVPFRQAELDQMLAPVALYPDSLLSQVLMASTYPLEVVQASRWSRANPGLKGQDAVRAVERMDWDPSVKSLTAFPQILTMMDEKIEWTERLGEAFLAQQADVMDSVQDLRRRAEAAGNLRSSDQMQVAREGEFITIRQPAPEVIYVPYYNPAVVYGPWWWPAYPPVYWGPPAGYYAGAGYWPGFYWGSGIVISTGFFFGYTNWNQRHVTVVNNNVVVNRTSVGNRPHAPVVWQHNPVHRRGVPFRHPETRQKVEQARFVNRDRHDTDRDNSRARSAPQPEARNPRPERAAPQAGDRRGERDDYRRPQARNTEPKQYAAAPVVHREPRPVAPAVTTQAAPQRIPEGSRRAESRYDGNRVRPFGAEREHALAARPSVSAPLHAPRVDSYLPRGGSVHPQGGGNQRVWSASRDSSRRF
jgi:hypothetical protein